MSEKKVKFNLRITWTHDEFNKCWDAFNADQEHLGWFAYERTGRFMHWCWYQNEGIRMSPGCLQEVRDKQKELGKTR